MSTTQLSVNREATRRRILLTLKKYSYLIAMVPLVLPPLLLAAGHATDLVNLFPWGVPVAVLRLIPVPDVLPRQDSLNPDEETDVPRMVGERFYKAITLGLGASFAASFVWSMR